MGSMSNATVLQETATDTRYNQLEQTLENFQVFNLFILNLYRICGTDMFCILGKRTTNGRDCE